MACARSGPMAMIDEIPWHELAGRRAGRRRARRRPRPTRSRATSRRACAASSTAGTTCGSTWWSSRTSTSRRSSTGRGGGSGSPRTPSTRAGHRSRATLRATSSRTPRTSQKFRVLEPSLDVEATGGARGLGARVPRRPARGPDAGPHRLQRRRARLPALGRHRAVPRAPSPSCSTSWTAPSTSTRSPTA